MTKIRRTVSRLALTSFLVFGVTSAVALAGDLSKYRAFQFGTDLATVAKQAGTDPSQAKVIHRRPALMQELLWRPQPLGGSPQTEAAREVVFSFFDGELYRIAVSYDRNQTEGLTADDFVESISATYGTATKPAPVTVAPQSYGYQDVAVAQWQDAQYGFDLMRSSYGPSFKLVGVLKRLEAPAQAAILEATRLDDQEAPQREAERVTKENDLQRARLEQVRLVNKAKFRP